MQFLPDRKAIGKIMHTVERRGKPATYLGRKRDCKVAMRRPTQGLSLSLSSNDALVLRSTRLRQRVALHILRVSG